MQGVSPVVKGGSPETFFVTPRRKAHESGREWQGSAGEGVIPGEGVGKSRQGGIPPPYGGRLGGIQGKDKGGDNFCGFSLLKHSPLVKPSALSTMQVV